LPSLSPYLRLSNSLLKATVFTHPLGIRAPPTEEEVLLLQNFGILRVPIVATVSAATSEFLGDQNARDWRKEGKMEVSPTPP
jgi:hypothetical protein